MATGPLMQVADVVVPEVFTPYTQQITEEKAELIQTGAMVRSSTIDSLLAGGGLTFKLPSFEDLDNDTDNVSSDEVADSIAWTQLSGTAVGSNYPTLNDSVPLKTGTGTEIAVRLNRNNSWSSANLAEQLAGADPLAAMGGRVGYYWTRRMQAAFIATWTGVLADNTANDSGDYTNDVSGASFVDGVTNFSAEAFLDAVLTMGDSQGALSIVMVHSVVMNRMQKNNLIDFIPDARGEVNIPTFLGRRVVVDDGMPKSGNVYQTWIFGAGATRLGVGTPDMATEIERKASAGNGGGQTVLHSRVEWCIHPVGHAFVAASPADGGPSNASSSNNLANAGSWNRVYPERKQVKFARLITREA